MVIAANIEGHQKRFEAFRAAKRPAEESDNLYIGGGDVLVTGWREREIIARHKPLAGASIIDLGCGIGRLTRYLAEEPIGSYLGTDIIPDILARAARRQDASWPSDESDKMKRWVTLLG